jgi:hypothetical protein
MKDYHQSGIHILQSINFKVIKTLPDTMNEDMLQDIMNDERRHTSNVYTSKLGIGLNCFSSVLSATSSIALIVVLLRSEKRLSSVYHRRIMSIAVATFDHICSDGLFDFADAERYDLYCI